MGYAALHRLLLPFPDPLERLPAPQRQALHSTFGLVGAPPADRFLVALGVLTLLADVAVGARLVAETAGNPLALIELTGELSPAEFAGVAALPDALRVAGSLQEVFARRLSRLRAEARLLLALAAAEQTAPQALIWRAAERLGIDPEAAAFGGGQPGRVHLAGRVPAPPGALGGLPPQPTRPAPSDPPGIG